jgi:hypothetical protein
MQVQVQLKPLWCGVDTSRCNTGKNEVERKFWIVNMKNEDQKHEDVLFWIEAKKNEYICTSTIE